PYSNFRSHWLASKYGLDSMNKPRSPDTIGPAGAYDIIYMFAYGVIAVGDEPLTGPNMVKYGLRKMVPGMGIMKYTIGPTHIQDPFPMLATGQPIDIEGTSGRLDFDKDTMMMHGEARSDIQIWCLPKGSAGTVADAAIYSGHYYDHLTD